MGVLRNRMKRTIQWVKKMLNFIAEIKIILT